MAPCVLSLVRCACIYSLMARSRWRVKSNIWPREIYDETSVHFGLKSPLSASRNSFAGSHVVVLLEKDLGNPEMRQRWTAQRCTAVRFKCLLIFLYGFAVFADLSELFASSDGLRYPHLGSVFVGR